MCSEFGMKYLPHEDDWYQVGGEKHPHCVKRGTLGTIKEPDRLPEFYVVQFDSGEEWVCFYGYESDSGYASDIDVAPPM